MANNIFNENISNLTQGYKAVLSYDVYDESVQNVVRKYAELDLQEGGIDVKSNVELTTFPIMRGFNISDHIFRQPIEISMKGKFAQNGTKAMGWTGVDRLTKIQQEFESLQRAGVKFEIVVMKNDNINNESNQRYLRRPQMVLTSIGWSEHQDVIDFNFDFKEAISGAYESANIQRDQSDPNLPDITELSAASLVGELISSDDVIRMTVDIMNSLEIINANTILKCAALNVGAIAIGASIVGTLVAIAAAGTAIPFVGWVVGIGCAIAAACVAIFEINKEIELAQRRAYYKSLGHLFLIEDDMPEEEKNKIAMRFVEFLNDVKLTVDKELSNISIYRIAKTDRQECILNMNGNYYVNQIEKNNDNLTFRIKTLYLGTDEVASKAQITGLENFADCNETSNAIYFRDIMNPKYRVYIINRASYLQYKRDGITTEDKLEGMNTSDAKKYELEKGTLLEYAFVVAPFELTNLSDKIAEIIKKKIG